MKLTTKKQILAILPFALRRFALKIWFFVSNPRLLLVIFSKFKSLKKTVLIISTPRCGSSWLGSILGAADTARYLREPITSSYMQSFSDVPSFFTSKKCKKWETYSGFANNAFKPSLNFSRSVITYPKQWLDYTTAKTTVIKEVNPLVLKYYLTRFSPQVIYLVRHPFSVAKSSSRLGWINEDMFSRRFSQSQLQQILRKQPDLLAQNYWFQSGYLQGLIAVQTQELLKKYDDSINVCYEELCQFPIEQFEKIFSFTGFDFSKRIKNKLTHSHNGKKPIETGDFSLVRDKNKVGKIVVDESEQDNYKQLMAAYKLAWAHYDINDSLGDLYCG
ncbi:MAG: hypothetical protein COB35_10580 [Gammaproteobacteria bacterium]|nr:MAG: hypothetical protein COB35_10580 [Gammaproteobacteria bacterium]